jgi:hypothetical protein
MKQLRPPLSRRSPLQLRAGPVKKSLLTARRMQATIDGWLSDQLPIHESRQPMILVQKEVLLRDYVLGVGYQ